MAKEDASSATPGTPVIGSGVTINAIPAFRIPPLRDGGLVTSSKYRLRGDVLTVAAT